MEERIRERFHQSILLEAMARYEIAPGAIQPCDAFESFIYEYERGPNAFILRLSHSLRRSEALIHGEVDWINHLAAGGVSVARAICSERDELVEAIDDGQGGRFLVTAFSKAQGRRPWDIGWTTALYETYGQLLGSMHALAVNYQPADPAWKRPEWNDDLFEYVEHFLPGSEVIPRQKYQAVLDHLATLPVENTSYGLIHQDAHGSNLLVDDARNITLFDFDDCGYSWFVNDIAIVLFYIALNSDDPPAFTKTFMTHFLRGYRRAYSLDPKWLKEIPYFLKLREMELYAVMYRDFDVENIDHSWSAQFMRGRKSKIEHDVAFIDFDFESLIPLL